jgi:phosphatidylserine decarboxylase precursor
MTLLHKIIFCAIVLLSVCTVYIAYQPHRTSCNHIVDIHGVAMLELQPILTTFGIKAQPLLPNRFLTWFTTNVCQDKGASTDPNARIQFARDYGVRWEDARLCRDSGTLEECVGRFGTLNDFFTRQIHPELTHISAEDKAVNVLVSPAESRMHIPSESFLIKGTRHSATSLLGLASPWLPTVASIAVFRLAPQDYHRVHSPIDGVVARIEDIVGKHRSVARPTQDILQENVRRVICLETAVGRMALVKVGATCVGSIRTSVAVGDRIQKGQDLGDFAFGGSCVVLVCEKAVQWNPRILQQSASGFETWMRAGTRLGTFPNTL